MGSEITDYQVNGYDSGMLGTQTVEITYEGSIVTFPINVYVIYPESDHPYSNDTDKTWTYTHYKAADYLEIQFSEKTETEEGYDLIYIYDKNGIQVGVYTGTELAGQIIIVQGNSFNIRIVSDESESKYGFAVDSVKGYRNKITAVTGSGCVVSSENKIIYGLKTGITETQFESNYVHLNTDARFVYMPASGILGTGTRVDIEDNNTKVILETYTIVIFGDVNGDGNIDSIDAGNIVDHENYLMNWDPVADAAYIKAGDLNGDGNVDSMDAGIAVDVENYLMAINQTTGLAEPI